MSELGPDLPEIHTEVLSTEALASKLEEIRETASQVSIQVKGGGMRMAEADTRDLRDIGQALQQGQSVQVRYFRDGIQWSDTFSMTDRGIQLIHFALPTGI